MTTLLHLKDLPALTYGIRVNDREHAERLAKQYPQSWYWQAGIIKIYCVLYVMKG